MLTYLSNYGSCFSYWAASVEQMLLIAAIAFVAKMSSSRVTRMSFALEFLSQRYKTPSLLETRDLLILIVSISYRKLETTQIPARLLGIHSARIIHLASCGDNLMTIHRNAFRSSSDTAQEFFVYECNVGSLTWLFLRGFTKVNLLHLEGATNIQSLGTLPSLPSLKRLTMADCKGFSSLFIFPGPSLNGLQSLIMTENVELTDGRAESILATLIGVTSLEMVSLKNNTKITRIPNTLANLVGLHSLDLSLCNVSSIPSGSLSFSANVKLLDLTNNSLSDIPNNSFEKGNSIVF